MGRRITTTVVSLFLGAFLLLVVSAPVAGANRPVQPRAQTKVTYLHLYLDTKGLGRGELLARTFAFYRRPNVSDKAVRFAYSQVTLHGPGGTWVMQSIVRLHHLKEGEFVDHRALLDPATARAVLRTELERGVRVSVKLYVLSLAAGARAVRASSSPRVTMNPRHAPDAHAAEVVVPQTVDGFPPRAQSWGGFELYVTWTETPPYRAYASSFTTPIDDPDFGSPVIWPRYDALNRPFSGFLEDTGSFSVSGGHGGTVFGKVPLPTGGRFNGNATITDWAWGGRFSCQGCPLSLPIDR
jgi:hypothetical protein